MNKTIYNYFKKLDPSEYSKHFNKLDKLIYHHVLLLPEIKEKLCRGCEIYIADLGAGICNFELELKKSFKSFKTGMTVVAFDFSSSLLKFGKEKVGEDFFQFVVADILKLPLKNNTIDLVFLINIIPYLEASKLTKMVSELARIVKNNGLVVVFHPSNDSYEFWETYFDGISLNFYSIDFVIDKFIESENFKVIRKKKVKVPLMRELKLSDIQITIGWLITLRRRC